MLSATRAARMPAFNLVWAWVIVAAVVYLSLSRTIVELPGDAGGRYGHVAAFALLMFTFSRVYRDALMLAAALFVLGVGLEYLQGYSGYRNFERADMVANAIGIGLGWVFGLGFTRVFFRRSESAA